jgi:hypothetical protein
MQLWTVSMRSGTSPECFEVVAVWDSFAAAMAHATRACREAIASPAGEIFQDYRAFQERHGRAEAETRFDLEGEDRKQIGFIKITPLRLNHRGHGLSDTHLRALLRSQADGEVRAHPCDPDAAERAERLARQREEDAREGRRQRRIREQWDNDDTVCERCDLRFREAWLHAMEIMTYKRWQALPPELQAEHPEPSWPADPCQGEAWECQRRERLDEMVLGEDSGAEIVSLPVRRRPAGEAS